MELLEIRIFVLWIVSACVVSASIVPVSVTINNGDAVIEIGDGLRLRLYYNGDKVYDEPIGTQMPLVGEPKWDNTNDELLSVWENGLQLRITSNDMDVSGIRVEWTAPSNLDSIQECFDLGDSNWFGGAELHTQPWPIQNQSFSTTAFIPNAENGGVLERYFLSPNIAYYLDKTIPLFVSLESTPDNKTLCFEASYALPYRNSEDRPVILAYMTITGSDLLDVHRNAIDLFSVPSGIPMEKMFRLPIWSTWATYKTFVNQTKVMQYAQAIQENGFQACQIELDDSWEAGNAYGVEVFDSQKFPNPIGMVNSLKGLGMDVTLWVHPFVNINSSTFEEGNRLHYFVREFRNNETGIVSWWNGDAGVIDVTNPEAVDWWAARLDDLRETIGIASFKFDAGETEYLPINGVYNSSEDLQPGIFSTKYAEFASKYGGQIEVRDGYGTQHLPVFVRLLDRSSEWTLVNGLRSVITSSLHFGIVGYPFVLPDMIGGNGYGIYPTEELFIRWVQVNAFLPTMQFSYEPWSFSQQAVDISRKMVELHQNISDVIIAAANQATVDGSPIIRPLWWISPNDTTAQVINDEFLVGNTFLVAPILSQGATWRHIYLPQGNWQDEISGQEIQGPIWLENYEVALDQIPYFTNLSI